MISAEPHPTRIGVISDTHMPRRWKTIPPAVFDTFRDVDLIVHAGDVGELWVLDQLGTIAPVIAVHGNDDTAEAQRDLPHRQLLSVGGQRILLWHSHYQDRLDEMAFRRTDTWAPKLDRLVAWGQRAGAGVVVSGHTHVPLSVWRDGVLLLNPGAVASGNGFIRQTVQTVALLTLSPGSRPEVTHVDLAQPERPFRPNVDLSAGFAAAAAQVSAPIVEPSMLRQANPLWFDVFLLDQAALEAAYLPLAHARWSGETDDLITWADLMTCIEQAERLSAETRSRALATLRRLAET